MEKRAIYYDTETTGLKPENDRIIEIAAYDPVMEKTFHSLINPNMPIPEQAQTICKITDDMVKDAPTFLEVAENFKDFCSGNFVLVAHNNDAFDKKFLEHEFKRCSIQLPDWQYIDSLKFSRKYRPDLPSYSLQDLCLYHCIDRVGDAHRALDDAISLYKLFSIMIDDLSMDDVIEIMSRKDKINRMPFGKHRGKSLSNVPTNYVRWLNENDILSKPDNIALKEEFIRLGKISI